MTQSILLLLALIVTLTVMNFANKQIIQGGVNIADVRVTQCFRGIAIMLVIMQHCAGGLGTNIFTPMGGVGVAMFLLLSGFGLTESYKKKGVNGFVKGRLSKVWIPFALFYICSQMLRDRLIFSDMLLELFSIKQGLWYVHYILRCYIVFWIAFRFFYKYRWIVFIAFSVYTFFGMDEIRAEQSLSFIAGIFISERFDSLLAMTKKKMIIVMLIMGLIGIISLAVKQMPWVREMSGTYVYSFVQLGIKLPLAIMVMIGSWLMLSKNGISSALTMCGAISYELYLVHIQMLGLVNSWSSAWMMICVSMLISYSLNPIFKIIQDACTSNRR